MYIFGKYQLVQNNNFDNYLRALGVNFVMRKILDLATPITEVTTEDCDFTITTWTTFKTKEIKFRHKEEFEEITGDGRHCKSVIIMHKPNGLRQIQKWDGKKTTIQRVYEFGEKMTMTLKFGDVVCTRVYTRFTVSLVGTYKLTESVNYEQFLEALGVDSDTRKLAITATPTTVIKKDDKQYTITTSTPFKTTEIKFELMGHFDEITADGRECKSCVTIENDNILMHIQWCNGQRTGIRRTFDGSKMIEELRFGYVECTRVHTKIKQKSKAQAAPFFSVVCL